MQGPGSLQSEGEEAFCFPLLLDGVEERLEICHHFQSEMPKRKVPTDKQCV